MWEFYETIKTDFSLLSISLVEWETSILNLLINEKYYDEISRKRIDKVESIHLLYYIVVVVCE